MRSRSPVIRDRGSAAVLKPSPSGPGSPRTSSKSTFTRGGGSLSGTGKSVSRSHLPRAGRPPSGASQGKENMLSTTCPANLSEDVCSPGTDDTVESGSFATASAANIKRPAPAREPVEYDDGKSTDITPGMLRDCMRKEGGHDDLPRLLAADLSGRNISLINRLNQCRMLRTLDLSYNRISSTRGLDSLYQLRELKLTCNKVPSIFEINKLTALEHLHLQVNCIGEIGKQSLRDNKKLRTLRLDGNALQKLQHLDGQVVLQQLDASQNQLTKIEGLGLMGQLETLALAFNQIQVIEGLGAMGRLRELDLCNNHITCIEGLKQCGQLEIVRLDDNQIQNLDGLTRLPNMMELYLNNNQLIRATAQIIKMCPGLEFLHMSCNNLTELSEVKAMEGLTNLIDLRLAENPICQYKGFNEHVQLYLSVVDTLDDEDIRGTRAAIERQDADKDKPQHMLKAGLEEDLELTDQVLDRGGVSFGKARDHGAKELAEVVPLEQFEEYLRSIRDGINNVKKDLHDSMYKLMFPSEKDKAEEKRKEEQRLREIKESDDRMAARVVQLAAGSGIGSYEKGSAAVAAVLQRKKSDQNANASSLHEIMQFKHKTGTLPVMREESDLELPSQPKDEDRQGKGPVVYAHVPAASRVVDTAGVHMSGAGNAATSKREMELPESMRRMNDELQKRLKATTEALRLELDNENDPDALSPRHPAPPSPTPHPTKGQIEDMRRAVDEQEHAQTRARTAASEAAQHIENEQHARFVEHLVDGTPEKPSTPPLRTETPQTLFSEHKDWPARDLERATPSKDYDLSHHSNILASAAKLRDSRQRLSYDPETWEHSVKRRHTAAETEMFSLDYETTNRAETSPARRRPQSSRPMLRAGDTEGGDDMMSTEAMRESLSSRAGKRLAEAIEFSATQSPASPCSHDDADNDEVLYEYEDTRDLTGDVMLDEASICDQPETSFGFGSRSPQRISTRPRVG